MTLIRINVSKLSKKILTRDHHRWPLKVTRRNTLYSLLHSDSTDKVNVHLTEVIELHVSSPPKSYKNAGENIHRFHLRMMELFVFAQYQVSGEGMSGINSFYDYYDLDDDDYDTDSAYRRWQRFLHQKKQDSPAFLAKKNKGSVLHKLAKKPLPELEKIVANFSHLHFSRFISQKQDVKIPMICQLRVWVYYHIGEYSISEIAKVLSISENKAYKSKQRFMELVHLKRLFPLPEASSVL